MNIKFIKYLLFSLSFFSSLTLAQFGGDPALLRIGFHTGNRAGISFYNDGQIAGFRQGVDIRGEWPLGSGENYIGDCIPLIGVEFENELGRTLQSVTISRGPRNGQSRERHPTQGYFWGFNPLPGFINPNGESVAMSHLRNSWPIRGWADPGGFPEVTSYYDEYGNTEWWGFFGRGIMQADQESYFVADDQMDDEFNAYFHPDRDNHSRNGMALQLRQRGFQWASFLAEDAIFWLLDINNEGTTNYNRANFGTVVGTLAGGDGDSGDDLGFFDTEKFITYSWDSDNVGNMGQEVGYVGYAFLESPGNPFDGIDNDGDSEGGNAPTFTTADFQGIVYTTGSKVTLIDPDTYERSSYIIGSLPDTVHSLGNTIVIDGVSEIREGHINRYIQGVAIPDSTATDGFDNDLDGLIDENESIHFMSRIVNDQQPLKFIDYSTGDGIDDMLIDEKRDNDLDEDGDWNMESDDVGQDGLGPDDDSYPGPDFGEGDGFPTQGEPNFGRTDPDESDQIGLTAFNFFNQTASPDMSNDSLLWARMTPGRFDDIPRQPQDGDFIYASGYFPLIAKTIERFSVAILWGEDRADVEGNQVIVQQIYNSGYKFPLPPRKPKITITHDDGNVVIYWDGEPTENSRDFILKRNDFQGYKIYRATDEGFQDSRTITNAFGVLSFDKPLEQYDLIDSVKGFFYPSPNLFNQIGGTTYYLGDNTGVINKYVDSTVTPGQTYYYAVVSYDSGDEELDIFPSENSKFIFREASGNILTDDNTGYITPGRRPAGYQPASHTDFTKGPDYKATGEMVVELVDDADVRDNFSYEIAYEDSALQGYTMNYSLIDLQTPDTVYVPTNNEIYLVDPEDSVLIPAGTDTIFVNSRKLAWEDDYYVAAFDTLINKSNAFLGNTKTVHGFRMQIYNHWEIKKDTAKSGFEGIQSDPAPPYIFFPFIAANSGPGTALNGIDMPYDYELEFFDSDVSMSVADTLYPPTASNIFPARPANFKVHNLTTGKELDFVYFKRGTFNTIHSIYFKEEVKGEVTRTWRTNITYLLPNAPLESEGKLKLFTTKPFSHVDNVIFTMEGAGINSAAAGNELDKVKVVPNPYIVTHSAEQRLSSAQTSGRGEREIRFTYIPPGSTIKIFTVRGELIKTLTHEELFVGDVYWNLRTDENIDSAYGIYIYVVEAPDAGKKIGKFALVK